MPLNLTDKAMMVRLSISMWTARKYDRKISEEVAQREGVSADMGRYNKVLIAEDAMEKLKKIASAARNYHYEQTLPWSDNGDRLLPSANYMNYTAAMRSFKIDYENARAEFRDVYPSLVQDAKWNLKGMFRDADYPTTGEVEHKFDMQVEVNPIPIAEDFRVTLQTEEIDKIRAEIEQRAQEKTASAMKDLWQRLYDGVAHMAERLKDKENKFKDSLVENLIELCQLLPLLNVVEDPNLEQMRKDVESKLCIFTPKTLRTEMGERKQAAEDAEDIMKAMAGYMGA